MVYFNTLLLTFGALFTLAAASPVALSNSQTHVIDPSTPPSQVHHQYLKSSLETAPAHHENRVSTRNTERGFEERKGTGIFQKSATKSGVKQSTAHYGSNAKKLKYQRYYRRRGLPTTLRRSTAVRRDVVYDLFNLITDLSRGQLERLFDLLGDSFIPYDFAGDSRHDKHTSSHGGDDSEPKEPMGREDNYKVPMAVTFLVKAEGAAH